DRISRADYRAIELLPRASGRSARYIIGRRKKSARRGRTRDGRSPQGDEDRLVLMMAKTQTDKKRSSAMAGGRLADAPERDDDARRDAYRVKLEIFEGPLDLLLYLIKKDEIDIYDIPIGRITEQYLAYLDLMQELDIAVAGDFLVMASTLIYIKSK